MKNSSPDPWQQVVVEGQSPLGSTTVHGCLVVGTTGYTECLLNGTTQNFRALAHAWITGQRFNANVFEYHKVL